MFDAGGEQGLTANALCSTYIQLAGHTDSCLDSPLRHVTATTNDSYVMAQPSPSSASTVWEWNASFNALKILVICIVALVGGACVATTRLARRARTASLALAETPAHQGTFHLSLVCVCV